LALAATALKALWSFADDLAAAIEVDEPVVDGKIKTTMSLRAFGCAPFRWLSSGREPRARLGETDRSAREPHRGDCLGSLLFAGPALTAQEI
jgi:hypothetical protein